MLAIWLGSGTCSLHTSDWWRTLIDQQSAHPPNIEHPQSPMVKQGIGRARDLLICFLYSIIIYTCTTNYEDFHWWTLMTSIYIPCFDPSVNGEDMKQEWERGWKLFKHISQLVGDFRHSRSFPPLMHWCNWAVEAIHDPARRLVAVRPSGCCHRRSRYFNIMADPVKLGMFNIKTSHQVTLQIPQVSN